MYASLTNFLLGRASRTLALSCLSYQPCLLRLKTKDVKAQSSKAEIKLNLKPYFTLQEMKLWSVLLSFRRAARSRLKLIYGISRKLRLPCPALRCAALWSVYAVHARTSLLTR